MVSFTAAASCFSRGILGTRSKHACTATNQWRHNHSEGRLRAASPGEPAGIQGNAPMTEVDDSVTNQQHRRVSYGGRRHVVFVAVCVAGRGACLPKKRSVQLRCQGNDPMTSYIRGEVNTGRRHALSGGSRFWHPMTLVGSTVRLTACEDRHAMARGWYVSDFRSTSGNAAHTLSIRTPTEDTAASTLARRCLPMPGMHMCADDVDTVGLQAQ